MWQGSVGVTMGRGFTVLSDRNLMFRTVEDQTEPYAGELLAKRRRGGTALVRHERKSSLPPPGAGGPEMATWKEEADKQAHRRSAKAEALGDDVAIVVGCIAAVLGRHKAQGMSFIYRLGMGGLLLPFSGSYSRGGIHWWKGYHLEIN